MKTESLFKKEVITKLIPIWENIPTGSLFEGTIENRKTKGRINKEGENIYLCQNTNDGAKCKNKLGFKYSYSIQRGSCKEMENNQTVLTSIKLDPKFKAPLVIIVDGNIVEFNKGSIKVGCTTVSNTTVGQIYKNLKS